MKQRDKLEQYMINPLNKFIGKRPKRIFYTDIGDSSELTTDNKGTDIIAQQVTIAFDDDSSLYLSWNRVEGWKQYAMSVSVESFVAADTEIENTFAVDSSYWETAIGKCLDEFIVYGYHEYKITVTSIETDESEEMIYYNQPHLIILGFENNQVGIANFYCEYDFEPKLPIGDDVWIIFNNDKIKEYINKFEFKELAKVSL